MSAPVHPARRARRLGPVRSLRHVLLALALAGVAPAPVDAQVRPHLAWRTLRTAHFRVHFTPELEALARRTAANAEAAWARLSDELAPPRGTVDIVLADNVDYANGYATPYPSNRIVLYARPPVENLALRNHADWNAVLLTHELVHIFHLDRVRGPWALAQRIFGRAAPLFPNSYAPAWITEGLAVHYETALTGTGRLAGTEFPALVRAAAIAGTLPSLDALSLATPYFPGGNRAYLYGSYAVTRPDSGAMRRYVDAASGRWIPWRHDANARDAFGESFSRHWRTWRDSVTRAERASGAGSDEPSIETRTRHGFEARFPRFTAEGSLVYVASDARSTAGLYALHADGARRRLGRRNSVDANVPVPALGSVQGELDYTDPYSLHTDLYRGWGLSRRRLTRGQRLAAPDAHAASGRIVAVRTEPGTTSLVILEPANDFEPRPLVRGSLDRTWAEPRLSRDGQRVAAVRWDRGGRSSIVVLDLTGRELARFAPRTPVPRVVSSPAWEPGDSTLLFVSDEEGRPMVYRGAVGAGAYGLAWSTATALNTPDVSPSGARLAAVELRADGYHVVTRDAPAAVPLDRRSVAPEDDPLQPSPVLTDSLARATRYAAWRTLLPRWWLPTFAETGPGDVALGFMTGGRDVVGRHDWTAEVLYSHERGEVTARGGWTFARLGIPVVFVSGQQEWQHAAIRTNTGALAGWLGVRGQQGAIDVLFDRPRVRLSSYLIVGGEAERIDFRTYPAELLQQFPDPDVFAPFTSRSLRASVGVSTMQRPFNALSNEDGVTASASLRSRTGAGSAQETIVAMSAAKSIPLPGFARHVVALRAAHGVTGHASGWAFGAGGISSRSLEILPGIVIGGSPRTFAVRGFPAGAQVGVRASAASAEYRAPLTLLGRGVRLLPVYFQKASMTAFADAGAAWCARSIADSFVCPAALPPKAWMASVGGELALDAALQYDRAYRFRLGFARPVEGARFAARESSVYFSLGSSF